MGDNRGKAEQRHAPGGGGDRIIDIARPIALKSLAFAKTVPARIRKLIERAELPRRYDQGRKWLAAQDLPAKADKFGHWAAESGRKAAVVTQKAASAAAAKARPILALSVERSARAARAGASALSARSATLSAALNDRLDAAAARKAKRKALSAKGKTPQPVPSQLMRLLEEEGVEIEGMDVREALPQPVRPVAIQGILPLFADDPLPPGQSR